MKKTALIFLVGPYSASLYTTIGLGFKVSKMHSWVVKLVFYLKWLARSIYLTAVRLQGFIERPTKIYQIGGPKYKIAYCEAKRDFKMSTIYCWDVKLVFYLKEAIRGIILTAVQLQGVKRAGKEQKQAKKGSKTKNCLL